MEYIAIKKASDFLAKTKCLVENLSASDCG
jgi:hypothetical protein